ncbi:hypothetical protein J2Y66_001034 [Paenarthrobacter nitroguajacolicus]|uniref:hypothetical protein n=1 Tax=Paenarthrobacter nitroguajacolicus TaxID=211146 RepID=UPI0028544366|nr:hypothetical protein [Paenarthrobacter nitroguajacolicus]MDR6986564.1 hypothetical protein [Paenarthrobacter nitroguajacolicus]
MTSRDTEREAIVDELLIDADLPDASDIRLALVSLGDLANLPAPAPSAELAAMIAGPHDELSKRRWRHKHRTAVVSIAVVAAMGLGVSGVAAASSGFTRNPSFIDELIGNFQPRPAVAAPVPPSPDAPKVTTEPAPIADPAAVPPPTEAASVPVPAAAPAENQAQAQAQAPAPGAVEAPAAGNPGAAVPHPAAPNTATPSAPDHGTAHQPPATPNRDKPQGQGAGKAEAAGNGAAKPAKPEAHGKQGPVLPSLSDKLSEEQFQDALDKWKKWLKHSHR